MLLKILEALWVVLVVVQSALGSQALGAFVALTLFELTHSMAALPSFTAP